MECLEKRILILLLSGLSRLRTRTRAQTGLGGGEVTFKVAYLTTEYDPTLIYGVKTTIETLTNTRLSCIHTSYPNMFTPRLEAVDFAVFVMTMTMYEPCLSVSQLSRLDVDTTQQLANRNDSYVSPGAVMMVSSGLAAAARVPRLILSRCVMFVAKRQICWIQIFGLVLWGP